MAIEILPTVAGHMKILPIGQKDGVWQGNLWTTPLAEQEVNNLWPQLAQFLRLKINKAATYPIQSQLWGNNNIQPEAEKGAGRSFYSDDYLDDLDSLEQCGRKDNDTQLNQGVTIVADESACRFSAAFWPETSAEPLPPFTPEEEEEYWRMVFEEGRHSSRPQVGMIQRIRAYRNGNLGTSNIKFSLPPKLQIAVSPVEDGLRNWFRLLADETSYQREERRLRYLGRNIGALLSHYLNGSKIPRARRNPGGKMPTFSRAIENALWLARYSSDLNIKNKQERMRRLAFALGSSGDLANNPHFFLEPARCEKGRKSLLSLEECMRVTTELDNLRSNRQDGQPAQLVGRDPVWTNRLQDLGGCQIGKTRVPNIFKLTGPIRVISW